MAQRGRFYESFLKLKKECNKLLGTIFGTRYFKKGEEGGDWEEILNTLTTVFTMKFNMEHLKKSKNEFNKEKLELLSNALGMLEEIKIKMFAKVSKKEVMKMAYSILRELRVCAFKEDVNGYNKHSKEFYNLMPIIFGKDYVKVKEHQIWDSAITKIMAIFKLECQSILIYGICSNLWKIQYIYRIFSV